MDYDGRTAIGSAIGALGAQATVCGGGRYDGLVEQLGGPPTACIGWALGLERLLILQERSGTAAAPGAPDAYLVSQGDAAGPLAVVLARDLRRQGLAVELDLSGAGFGKQLKRADRSGARWAVLLGDREAEDGTVRLKDLRQAADGGDAAVPQADLAVRLRSAGG